MFALLFWYSFNCKNQKHLQYHHHFTLFFFIPTKDIRELILFFIPTNHP